MRKQLTTIGMFLLLYFMVGSQAVAQQRQVTGTITSADGLPVKQASIQVIGTNRGTSADEQGNFRINAAPGEELQVSSVGFLPYRMKLEQQSKLLITLTDAKSDLGEVVVTALGITRAKKTLGYSVQKLDGSQLNQVRDNNIVNSLSGKIAGVQVTSGGSAV